MILNQNLVVSIIIGVCLILLILFIAHSIEGGKTIVKNRFISLLLMPMLLVGCANNKNSYVLNESTFFLVMTNIQYYPEEYVNKELTFDSFTYELEDIHGEKYLCVVRKCASGFGCKCGKDTIIGFVVDEDLDLPAPKNQYENTNDKSWIHVVGMLENDTKKEFEIYGVDNIVEKVSFLTLKILDFSIIEDYSKLHYYVDK